MTAPACLVGLCGAIGAGKDTVADILVQHHGFYRMSFADALKDAVAVIFGWARAALDGRTPEDRTWREAVDVWWARRLQIPHLTPRWVLQHWGTETCRHGFHTDVWVAALERRLQQSLLQQDQGLGLGGSRVVVTDCRFPNEFEALRRQGAFLVRVNRPNPSAHAHVSETAWQNEAVDAVLHNDGSLRELHHKIEQLECLQVGTAPSAGNG